MSDDLIAENVLAEYLPTDAVACLDVLARISQTFDDLVDGDNPVKREDIYALMLDALVGLPTNPFWSRHFPELLPLLHAGINQWIQANDMEATGDVARLRVSYVTRSVLTPIAMHIVYLAMGCDWRRAREIAFEVLPLIFDEPFDAYVNEHSKGQ